MVLLALVASEVYFRAKENSLSADIKVPLVSKSLASNQGRRVLILGNSLAKEDLKLDIIEREAQARLSVPVHVERVSPVNTRINDWYYVYKHHFDDTQQRPDVLVVCFSMNHLEDYTIQKGSIARYHSSARDVPEIFREDVQDFDGRVSFLLDELSAAYTFRAGVQQRVLALIVPHYFQSAGRVNEALRVESQKHQGGEYRPTFRHLEKLLEMARRGGVRVIVVAMPVSFPYRLNPEIESTVEAAGASFIDTRAASGIDAGSYVDSLHMNDGGATVYSQAFARQLAEYLQ